MQETSEYKAEQLWEKFGSRLCEENWQMNAMLNDTPYLSISARMSNHVMTLRVKAIFYEGQFGVSSQRLVESKDWN